VVATPGFTGFSVGYERLEMKHIFIHGTDQCRDSEGQKREFHSGDGVRSRSNAFVSYDARRGTGKVFCPSVSNMPIPLSFQD